MNLFVLLLLSMNSQVGVGFRGMDQGSYSLSAFLITDLLSLFSMGYIFDTHS